MWNLLFLIICLSHIFACSSNTGPDMIEIRKSLAVDLPAYIEISSFHIEASQNAGTEVDQLYKARFRATLRLKTDTFLEQEREKSVLFVQPIKKQGESVEVFGRAESRLYAGSWQTSTRLDGSPLSNIGMPLSMHNSPNVIVKGTKKEEEYRAEQQRIAEENRRAKQERFDRRQRVVLSAFSDAPTLKGEANSQRATWPFSLHVKSFDSSDGKWSGEIKWITLDAVHRVEGTIIGTKVKFVETDFIKKGKALIGCTYSLDLYDNETRLTGSWKCKGNGDVWINIR